MKLSEAIRRGALLKPQGHGDFFYNGKTCALGAALDAAGRLHDFDVSTIATLWPVEQTKTAHPVTGRLDILGFNITSLNDVFGWTREQIADWVETIEQLEPVR